ncbi:biopolymer transport protein ExbD [Thioclava sp. ES.031]|uniref:ExbD/TolR family protein n=1 Tax=Thioclava sp. ES.031 TaxID=1798203 RepID=UPI000BF9DA63|nr:biopolymer transporter ExbD [Thioclava sp. ES.031]PFG62685.1 biopolymer transport protein ExbD [Thioclava sp. ES.031]
MFAFGQPRPRRRPALTPMIDVVFLLLVFFMLASRFGVERTLDLTLGGGKAGADWSGPPRLVDVGEGGAVSLNGQVVALSDLAGALQPLMDQPSDPVVLRPKEGDLSALTQVIEALRGAGLSNLVLVP